MLASRAACSSSSSLLPGLAPEDSAVLLYSMYSSWGREVLE